MSSELKQSDHTTDSLPSGTKGHPEPSRSSHSEPDHAAVNHELELIVASPFFHASKRSQQFLKYVVQYRLGGNEEPLKERTIGTMLYNRPADYATGDDSVVRVQASEVRRRLEQYYQEPPTDSLVRIELPLGSYAPEFRWVLPHRLLEDQSTLRRAHAIKTGAILEQNSSFVPLNRKRSAWVIGLGCALLVAGILTGSWIYQKRASKLILTQFWSPIFTSSKPLLICLPKTVLYRPSIALYERSAKTTGEFDNEVDRMNGRPHLNPDDMVHWGDMIEYHDFGLGKGDVEAAFRLSGLLAKLGKDTELRIGSDYGWDDLRNAPAVVIGAFSNPWTMKITSGLHFTFAEHQPGLFRIQEQGPAGRAWFPQFDPRTAILTSDYGLVTRLVNSSTGQFVVCVAGITAPGSEAAAEVAAKQEYLQEALRNAPSDWPRKNVQIVVKATVIDAVAGPPEIVAVYVW